MERMRTLVTILLATIICGCEAIGVPFTDDPSKKLGMAVELLDHENRPLPAERLIEEAISIYKSNNDEAGLAGANDVYGYFFRSVTVSNWGKYFMEHPFIDKSATYQGRYAKSRDYYQLAANTYMSKGMLDKAANIHYSIGITYELQQDKNSACAMFDQAIADHAGYESSHPGITYNLPAGVKTYQEYVQREKQKVGC